MANHLTVIIPCKDEERNIAACLESVRLVADEIIVADSGSTDDTLPIVRRSGVCRIIEREFVNDANFKNWAIPQASHRWVMIVDADERVDALLADEIRGILAGSPEHDGYRVRFRPYFLGYRIRHSGWNSTSAVRLFLRDAGRYAELRVHADVIVPSGKVGWLKGKLAHYTCQSLGQYLTKVDRYATWSAQDMFAAGRRTGFWGLLLRPPARFLQFYILRGGFLDGVPGVAVCMTMAYYTFMKYAKLWELTIALAGTSGNSAAQSSQDEAAGRRDAA